MDYYSILGVPKNATQEQIRKAYKKQSMQHHPDRGGNEEQFKKVNEAYQTLSDAQKRAAYDNPQRSFNTSNMEGWGDIFGAGGPFGFGHRRPRNPDIRIKVSISIDEVYTGKQVLAAYRLRNGQEQTVNLDIPIGASEGDTIRFQGLGDNSIPGQRGDLYVIIDILPHPLYTRNSNNVQMTLKVNCLELITGTSSVIKTPEGKNIELKIPPSTKNGTVFSMNGYGLPSARTGSKGTFFIKVEAEIPKLNSLQIAKIQEVLNGS
jgi:curved DNA-binding protein